MILIVNLNEQSLAFDEFVKPIGKIIRASGYDWSSVHYSQVSPSDLQIAEKVILSGTPLKDFTYKSGNFEWLKEFNKPVLGICAGMQVLALTFNSQLKSFKHIGMVKINTVEENPLFDGEFSAYSLHRKAVEPSKEFIILARSSKCVEAIRHKSKHIYGVLFHPEVRNPQIIENFVKKVK